MSQKYSLIYHYSNIDALYGMLKDYSISNPYITMRATHAFYLNDPSEYEYGKKVCLKLLKKIEKELKPQIDNIGITGSIYQRSSQKDIQDYFRQWEYGAANIPTALGTSTPYIISFSKQRDFLPMWTTYARNGQGVTIGFDSELLQNNRELYTISPCAYSIRSREFKQIKDYIVYKYKLLLQDLNGADTEKASVAHMNFMVNLHTQVAAYIKHNGFSYEKEVRCRANKADAIEFRVSKDRLIPYANLHIPISCVREIMLGPAMDGKHAEMSVKMFLRSKGIDISNIRITKSELPYRA